MTEQCFSNQGEIGSCLKHKPWINMHKTVFISALVRLKYPKAVHAIEFAAAPNISNTKIFPLAAVDNQSAKVRRALAMLSPMHGHRHVWIVIAHERSDFICFNNVMQVKMFIRHVPASEGCLSLTGLGGR